MCRVIISLVILSSSGVISHDLIGLDAIEFLRNTGFSLSKMRKQDLHVCGLNEDENLQSIGQYSILRPDTWPRKRMIMNKLLGSIDEANYSLDRVVICKGPFDQHISNCIENLMTEREEINKFLIAPSQSCTIARMAKTDGIVLELGETGASCCTIYDGTILKDRCLQTTKLEDLN